MSKQMSVKVSVSKKAPPANEMVITITDAATSQPVAGVKVEVATFMGQLKARGTTDNAGLFKAIDIPDGDYGCRFEHPEYGAVQKMIKLPSGTIS